VRGRGRAARLCGAVLCALALLAGSRAPAQSDPFAIPRDLPVALIADEIVYDSVARRLTARGSVQVFYGERTLTADMIVYDQDSDRITATGALVLRNPDGSTIHADFAELDSRLQDGLVRSARAMLDQRFRLAAVEARRVGGRFNVLGKAVFSTCEVCAAAPEPLWQIRARRIVHDEIEQRIFYEDAVFDVAGVPVFGLPYFQHPDPRLERGTGFLVPAVRLSDTFGYGIKTPFYWVIDEGSDLTLTPFVTTGEGLVMEGEYRRAFLGGTLGIGGAIVHDDDAKNRNFRGFAEASGHYFVTDSIFARFDGMAVSDDAFLTEFDYSDTDRLTSDAAIARYGPDGFWEVGAAFFQSLREGEGVNTIPLVLPEVELRETWEGLPVGGIVGLSLSGYGLRRPGDPPFTGPGACINAFGEDITCGQDTARASAALDWERTWITAPGVTLTGYGAARFDLFRVWDSPDPAQLPNGFATRFTPTLGVSARWPLIRTDASATHIVEPIAELYWSEPTGDQLELPNEDSLQVELDETNLFAVSRFSGWDRVEPGLRANVGLRYERIDAAGWNLGLVGGRIFRTEVEPVFAGLPGLNGEFSDYVAAFTLSHPPHLGLVSRVLLRDDFSFDRNELRLDLAFGDATFSGSYIYLSPEVAAGAPDEREEGSMLAGYRLNDSWSLRGGLTYDLQTGSFVRAGGGITWSNECVEVDFSISRRFTSSGNIEAATSVGLQVRLAGLGTEPIAGDRAGRCRMLSR
jgi:LPS-assembly protein